jgi:hypothetical protein
MPQPENLTIIKVYRFKEEPGPEDPSVLYVLKISDGQAGYSIEAYGIYDNHNDAERFNDFLRQVNKEDREDQSLFDTQN